MLLLHFQVMTAASLSSILVKCLYLFFDLPEYESPSSDATPLHMDKEFTQVSANERIILLQKLFAQVRIWCFIILLCLIIINFLPGFS